MTSPTINSQLFQVLFKIYTNNNIPSSIGASCFVPMQHRPIHAISGHIGSSSSYPILKIQSRYQMTDSNEAHEKFVEMYLILIL